MTEATNKVRLNHTSTDYGVWVDYNGQRFKDPYSIETLDGVVYNLALPNGGGWYIQPEIDMTAEEYQAVEKPEDIRRKPVPESKYYEAARGRVDDQYVKRIALVPDDQFPPYGWWETGVNRIRNNRAMNWDLLSPNEPVLPEIDPIAAKAKYLSFAPTGVELTKELKNIGALMSEKYVRYMGPVTWTTPDFTRNGREFSFSDEITLELIPEYLPGKNSLQRLFQRGWRFKATLTVTATVVPGQTLGVFKTAFKDVLVTQQGRGSLPELSEFLPHGAYLHFTFYYDTPTTTEEVEE